MVGKTCCRDFLFLNFPNFQRFYSRLTLRKTFPPDFYEKKCIISQNFPLHVGFYLNPNNIEFLTFKKFAITIRIKPKSLISRYSNYDA
jgi:hypothetical protein